MSSQQQAAKFPVDLSTWTKISGEEDLPTNEDKRYDMYFHSALKEECDYCEALTIWDLKLFYANGFITHYRESRHGRSFRRKSEDIGMRNYGLTI